MAVTSPDNIWTPDAGDDYALTVDLAAMADTIQDALNSQVTLRATSTGDASLTSTDHGFQVGPTTGTNLIADNNEIMVRNNGSPANLILNADGGGVTLGSAASTISIPGHVNSPNLPWAMAAGTVSVSSSGTATVSFPSGRFSVAPIVTLNGVSAGINAFIGSVSATSVTILVRNGPGAAVAGVVHWHAVQMTSSSGAG